MGAVLDFNSWKRLYENAEGGQPGADAAYTKYKNDMWKVIWTSLCIAAKRTKDDVAANRIYYNWKYPQDEQKGNTMKNQYTVGKSADLFNSEFNKRLKLAMADNSWLTTVANSLNGLFKGAGTNTPDPQTQLVQQYIKSKLSASNPDMVENNGKPGQEFADGVFYAHSTKAYVQMAMNSFVPSALLERTSIEA
jgi:hypothetical protein